MNSQWGQGYSHLKTYLGLQNLHPRWVTHTTSKLDGCWPEVLVPLHMEKSSNIILKNPGVKEKVSMEIF